MIFGKKNRKKTLAWILALCLLLPAVSTSATDSSAASVNTVESEFDALSEKFGAALNDQMEKYLSGSNTSAADIETDTTTYGLKSAATFQLSSGYDYPIKTDSQDADEQISRWVNHALATYPSLCTLFTDFTYTSTVDSNNKHYLETIKIRSPLRAGEITDITNSYKKALSSVTNVPSQSKTMTAAEKILYVHDRLSEWADYGDADDYAAHTAQALLLENIGVCQSFTYVFNQAMTELGIDCLPLFSANHSWNAVRLDGKWYYVDVTYDSPVGVSESFVRHNYLLFTPSASDSEHTMTADYKSVYGKILNAGGNAYDSYFPKTTQTFEYEYFSEELALVRPFSYLNGTWYFSSRRGVYTWDGSSSTCQLMSDIPAGNAEVCSAVYGNSLYYSTPEGIFQYKSGEEDKKLADGNIGAMALRGSTLYYTISQDDTIHMIPLVAEPEPTATPLTEPTATEQPLVNPQPTQTVAPTQTAAPTITVNVTKKVPAPAKPTIKSLIRLSKSKARVKIKAVSNASGYQIYYATKKTFSNKAKVSGRKTNIVLKKLKKKTYYVKVRAYILNNGVKTYGKWSKVKKLSV